MDLRREAGYLLPCDIVLGCRLITINCKHSLQQILCLQCQRPQFAHGALQHAVKVTFTSGGVLLLGGSSGGGLSSLTRLGSGGGANLASDSLRVRRWGCTYPVAKREVHIQIVERERERYVCVCRGAY